MTGPLVSIIINCYNSEKYLKETIDSMLAQTYKNWEAIFWDNCSTDETSEIIKSYKDSRFRYFLAEKNTPLGEARNLAMKNVGGTYMCFLDSDDVWNMDFIRIGIGALENSSEAVAFYSNYNEWRGIKKTPHNKGRKNGIHSFKYLLRNYGMGMSAVIIRTDVVKSHKIKFDSNYQLIEDMDFFYQIAYYGSFIYDERPLYDYRIYPENNTSKRRQEWENEFKNLYTKLENRYILTPNPVLEKEDLEYVESKIRNSIVINLMKQDKRFEFLKYYLKDKNIRKDYRKQLLFVLFGRDVYYRLKTFF